MTLRLSVRVFALLAALAAVATAFVISPSSTASAATHPDTLVDACGDANAIPQSDSGKGIVRYYACTRQTTFGGVYGRVVLFANGEQKDLASLNLQVRFCSVTAAKPTTCAKTYSTGPCKHYAAKVNALTAKTTVECQVGKQKAVKNVRYRAFVDVAPNSTTFQKDLTIWSPGVLNGKQFD